MIYIHTNNDIKNRDCVIPVRICNPITTQVLGMHSSEFSQVHLCDLLKKMDSPMYVGIEKKVLQSLSKKNGKVCDM